MRLSKIAVLASVAALALGVSFGAASAAPKHKTKVVRATDISSQARTRTARTVRARTRITVHPRSYLDPGTEVLPGQEKFTDYAFPLGDQTGLRVVSGSSAPAGWQNPNWPLPGPFDLPSRDNPAQFGE